VEPEKTPRDRAEDLISLLLGWRPTPQHGVWVLRLAVVLVVLVAIGYAYNVTLLDWLKLLIVPAVIAGVGIWFNHQQRERELGIAREQREQDTKIAEIRTNDEALQAYFDQMGRLLLDKDTQLGKSEEGAEVRTLARAWTLTVLTRLGSDGLRKRSVVQFLYEAKLLTKDRTTLDLREAFLNFAKLNGSDFNLTGVNLHGASLTKVTMNAANLGEANLSDTKMFGANLHMANLSGADMRKAVVMSANTDSTPLPRASATGDYEFHSPEPKNANLELADLSEVDLTDAYVSEEQLLSAASLAGATMPDGQKYEDWLKSKEDRGQNEGERGPR
jgi:uncharacterized protein YjbI with pentapeptide repeats